MTLADIVDQVSFSLGIPADNTTESANVEKAALIAFRELKRYIKKSVDKTVPYSRRIDLVNLGINTLKVTRVKPAYPRIGLSLNSFDSANVFQVAAAVNTYSAVGTTSGVNIDPIVTEMARAQVRNTLATDFQWSYDSLNQVIYCAHRAPIPTHVTISYVPDFKDVSEITSDTLIDYLVRLTEAHMKKSWGRSRTKYTIEGSNVTLDGEILLQEANEEFAKIREELENTKSHLVVLN